MNKRNNYAIGADGVAEAMQRGGTVLSEYGVSLSDSVGLITAANEAIQDSSKVGTALKTISINMAGVKANASKGTLELNKTAKTLKEIAGIDVYSDKSKGEIKNMVEILDELNKKLEEGKLNQDEFLAVSEALAGKENAAVLQSLMGNYDTFKQMQKEFTQGLHFGSAEKENAAYVDSLNGKLNKLKEIWIDTLMVLADSDSVKGLFDTFIEVSEAINGFIKKIDEAGVTLPVLFGIIAGGKGAFSSLLGGLDDIEQSGSNMTGIFGTIGKVITGGVLPAIKSFGTKGLVVGAVTAAVTLGYKAWDNYKNRLENTAKELEKVEQGFIDNIQAQDEKIKILETTGKEYEKLANKAKKTKEEEERLIELGNELATAFPEVVIDYDENGNAILNMTSDIENLIDKTKTARNEYNNLLLGTRIEQSNNALEGVEEDNKKKVEIQEAYNTTMDGLKHEYLQILKRAGESEGKEQDNYLKRLRELNNEMLVEESKFQTQYAEVQSDILEKSSLYRNEMTSTWQTSASLLSEALDPKLEKNISSFINALDFSEINTEVELEATRRIFRELPQLAQDGAVDVKGLTKKITDLNKEFAKTGDTEKYNKKIQELAETVSKDTNWDTNTLIELFDVITDGTLDSAVGLDKFLESFGKTRKDLLNGDSIGLILQDQFNEVNRVLNSINTLDFSDKKATLDFRVALENNQDLPKQIRDMVSDLAKAGVEDRYVISVAGELMMSLKDGKLDENEVEYLRERLTFELQDKFETAEEVELTVNGILESFNSEEILKSIEEELGKTETKKPITMTVDTEKSEKEVDKAKALLDERDLTVKLKTELQDDADYVYFAQIIRKLPTNEEFTYKFISENKEALAELKTYEEVVNFIKENPELIQTYKIRANELGLTTQEVEKLNEEIATANGTELNIETSNDDVLGTIEDVEALIKLSTEVEKGKYKIDIEANTKTAIDNVDLFKEAINLLNESLSSGKSVTYNADTAQAAKNISGLMARVDEIKKKTGKTFKYYSVTAQAAKNISGLIARVEEISALSGKTFYYDAKTAQAAKNISGLIKRVNEINSLGGKSISYSVNTNYTTSGNSGAGQSLDAEPVDNVSLINEELVNDSVLELSSHLSFDDININPSDIKAITRVFDGIDLTSLVLDATKIQIPSITPKESVVNVKNENILFNSPLIHIEGNVDKAVMNDLEKFGSQLKKDIVNELKNGDIRKKRLEGR